MKKPPKKKLNKRQRKATHNEQPSPRSLSQNKKLREYAAVAIAAGWRIEKGKRSGHLKWYPPGDKPFITTCSTPSDIRALHKIKSDLRRIGGLTL